MPDTSNDGIHGSAASLEVGRVFAGYRISRALGTGGMGAVYLATHPRLPREEALKVLPAHLTADSEFRGRFEREAELAAGLSHPHIVRIHDRGEADGKFWISMDYVEGTDAARLLSEHYPAGMPLTEALPIITAIGSALDYAHYRGLLHRDVKPANILLTDPDGHGRQVYLADFGIARLVDDTAGLTETNITVGTVCYAAPEQLRGEAIDGRADQYALAGTAFHLLTGVPPYGDANPAVVISRHVNAPVPSIGNYRPELAALDPVFATAMAKERSARFGSCREFTEQLNRYLHPNFAYADQIPFRAKATNPRLGVTAPAVPPPDRRRAPRRGLLAGAMAAVLVTGGVFAGTQLSRQHNPASVTEPDRSTAPPTTAPNTGPFTGIYRLDFGSVSNVEGEPAKGAAPTTETWAVRSVCGNAGCIATASRLDGETMQVPAIVLDQVGGDWLAVSVGSSTCGPLEGEVWEAFALQPHPDGIFVGEATQTMTKGCANKRTVTFTRTGDVDVTTLPSPSTLPARVVSPAEALHGRYHQSSVQPNGFREQNDYAVETTCLRAGDRCMSLFHRPPAAAMAMVFGAGNWFYDREFDAPCAKGGMTHVRIVVPFPLPQPLQNPVALISGHGHEELTGAAGCGSTDVDVKFVRIGD
ncbi:serine/threonine-protein kinase [Mycobacterium sp. 852002-51163_SCH5372311]|uniref:serine/threonine-protein kinase n=1 Tax=Mycobacterium sp. 852002-51163_SCH5372311 TaxID=1834097 RepID=UPI001E536AE3|nr:serine/threonine-protein kinase [Mycobacterium sp. 852002-51163_SCH5372311]